MENTILFGLALFIILALLHNEKRNTNKKKSPVFNPDISDLTEKVEIFSLTTEEKTTENPLEEKPNEKEGGLA